MERKLTDCVNTIGKQKNLSLTIVMIWGACHGRMMESGYIAAVRQYDLEGLSTTGTFSVSFIGNIKKEREKWFLLEEEAGTVQNNQVLGRLLPKEMPHPQI